MTKVEEEKKEVVEEVKYERQMMLESPKQAPQPNNKLRLFNHSPQQQNQTNRRAAEVLIHDDTPLPTFAKFQ